MNIGNHDDFGQADKEYEQIFKKINV